MLPSVRDKLDLSTPTSRCTWIFVCCRERLSEVEFLKFVNHGFDPACDLHRFVSRVDVSACSSSADHYAVSTETSKTDEIMPT